MQRYIKNLITLYHGFLEQIGRLQPIILYEKKVNYLPAAQGQEEADNTCCC